MKRYLLSIILCLWASCAWAFPPGFIGAICSSGSPSFSCSTTPFIIQDTHDASIAVSDTATNYYFGFVNSGSAPFTLCAIELYAKRNGDVSGKTLYAEKWSINAGTQALVSKIEDVYSYNPLNLPTVIGYSKISFGKTVTINKDEALVFTFNETTGISNNLTIAFKANGSTINDQHYNAWLSTKVAQFTTLTKDLRIKYYAPN